MASELLWSVRPPVQPCSHTVAHDLESFEWVILFAVYKHSIQRARVGAKERLAGLTKEFQNVFPTGIDPPTLVGKRTILLDLLKLPGVSRFRNIQMLLSFTEDVMGSKELHDVLVDVWLDLVYRRLALSAHAEAPALCPGSFFHNKNFPVFVVPHMQHRDLIWCLENLLPRP